MLKFLKVASDITLSKLTKLVGSKNVDNILAANSLTRVANIGKQLIDKQTAARVNSKEVTREQKISTLNSHVGSSDVFEELALLSSNDWKVMNATGSLPNRLVIPESVNIPDSADLIGNGRPVSKRVYSRTIECIRKSHSGEVDSSIFNDYDANVAGVFNADKKTTSSDPFQWFQIPWGDISLHSSIENASVDFPVYPEEMRSSRSATYTQMPGILFQYEPWQTYESSGPRSETYTFHAHRDMWTGDHRDGLANNLIRFCEANCYPDYNGSAVNTSIVTLFVKGKKVIRGVMTSCETTWTGPIGLDGWYLEFTITLSITEVSETPLNYKVVRSKGLIE